MLDHPIEDIYRASLSKPSMVTMLKDDISTEQHPRILCWSPLHAGAFLCAGTQTAHTARVTPESDVLGRLPRGLARGIQARPRW